MKITLAMAIKTYQEAYKAFHGYLPNINPDMTVRELLAHAREWRIAAKDRASST